MNLPVNDSLDVFNAILEDIRSGIYPPGSKIINERRFAEKYRVSRGTIRKALARLEKNEIIQRRVGSGTYLSHQAATLIEMMDADVKIDAVKNSINFNTILEARLIMEPGVISLAANNATPRQITAIYDDLEKIKTVDCWLEFKELIYSFFRKLYCLSDNSFLVSIFDQIVEQRRRTNFDGIKLRSKVAPIVCQRVYEDLEHILRPVSEGDALEAEKRSREYLLRQYCSQ